MSCEARSYSYVDSRDPRLRVPEPPMVGFFIGLDLGQAAEIRPSAWCAPRAPKTSSPGTSSST